MPQSASGPGRRLKTAQFFRWVLKRRRMARRLRIQFGNPGPFVSFGHKLVDMNSRMPFGFFEESHDYFRKTRALD